MNVAAVTFPGSNCDYDLYKAVEQVEGDATFVWHRERELAGYDAVMLPGGFSYGDYLRAGAIVKNDTPRFESEDVLLRVERTDTLYTADYTQGQILRVPIAHGAGNHEADRETLDMLEAEDRIVFRYVNAAGETTKDFDLASRPQVQVGDPFTEKLLLEASLEIIANGAITGIQDMGAAGITSSASEMAGRAGNGVEIEMAAVSDARKPFETPVTGGNVSFYNETDGVAICPTPGLSMVGVVEDADHITPQAFQAEGNAVILLDRDTDEVGGSEYLYALHGVVAGAPPEIGLLAEHGPQQALLGMIQAGMVQSAHDCADGGLACTLAESCLGNGVGGYGVDVKLDDPLRPSGRWRFSSARPTVGWSFRARRMMSMVCSPKRGITA